jgi:hypothetical protein
MSWAVKMLNVPSSGTNCQRCLRVPTCFGGGAVDEVLPIRVGDGGDPDAVDAGNPMKSRIWLDMSITYCM